MSKFKNLSSFIIIGGLIIFLFLFLKKGAFPAVLWIVCSTGLVILGFICVLIYQSLSDKEKTK